MQLKTKTTDPMKSKLFLDTRYEFIVKCLLNDKSLQQTAEILTAQGLKITGRGLSYWLTRRKARIESRIAKFTTPSDFQPSLPPALSAPDPLPVAPKIPALPAVPAMPALQAAPALPTIPNLARSKNQNVERNNDIDALIRFTNKDHIFASTLKKPSKKFMQS